MWRGEAKCPRECGWGGEGGASPCRAAPSPCSHCVSLSIIAYVFLSSSCSSYHAYVDLSAARSLFLLINGQRGEGVRKSDNVT